MIEQSLNAGYINLSFITDEQSITNQIINTILFKHVLQKFKKIVSLGTLLESTQYGYTASAKSDGKYLLVRITDIREGKINWNDVPFCECDRPENYLLSKGDILVARTGGTTGKSFIVEKCPSNSIFASYLIRLRIDRNKVDPKFIFYYLNSYFYWSQITNLKSGSAQPNVNAQKLSSISIPYCDKKEQEKLIELIETKNTIPEYIKILEEINQTEADFRKIKQTFNLNNSSLNDIQFLRQSILQEAAQGKLTPQNPNDEPASELLKRIKAEKEKLINDGKIHKERSLPPISKEEPPYKLPIGWEWTRMGDVTNYGTSEKANANGIREDTWVLDLEDIEKDTSKLIEKMRFKDRRSKSTKSVFYKNDVLYGKLRPYLDKVIVADEGGVCTTEILPIRSYGEINPEYLRIVLKSPDFLNYVSKVVYGMKMPRLGTRDGRMALIPVPPVNQQKIIVHRVETLVKLCDKLEMQIRENEKNSKALMEAILMEAFETNHSHISDNPSS